MSNTRGFVAEGSSSKRAPHAVVGLVDPLRVFLLGMQFVRCNADSSLSRCRAVVCRLQEDGVGASMVKAAEADLGTGEVRKCGVGISCDTMRCEESRHDSPCVSAGEAAEE